MRQKLGQHFLTNAEVLAGIAAAIDPQPGETIIEIGPGHGELTEYIFSHSERSEESMTKLILIERDTDLIPALREKFPKAEVIEGDVLKVLPSLIFKLQPISYKLCGNLPYYLTGFLLRTIEELSVKPTLAVFTIQKEVAERITASVPHMNRLAAAIQFWAEPQVIGIISRTDFDPPPEVDSATITLKTKNEIHTRKASAAYYFALHAIFQQPRKTISNNIAAATGFSRAEIAEKFAALGLNPEQRPQDLTVKNILDIGKAIFSEK